MLDEVEIRDPERVYMLYPQEVAGGIGQRITIAMMLLPAPEIQIADDPTAALGVSVQAEILNLLVDQRREHKLTYIMVSHDLGVAGHMCERIAVMKDGRFAEGLGGEVMRRLEAKSPYTRHLLQSSNTSTR
ncbi:MAG: hypothetical protein QNK42_17595 [Pseudodonghicola sp.]|nr:hypothetical protein [Pseudodonghicola sp.]